jgi:hypothetical protein
MGNSCNKSGPLIKRVGIQKTFVTLVLGLAVGGGSVAQAVQLADGTVYFAQPPDLVAATTTFKSAYASSTYYFTLNLPATAGEPLQKVTLTQQEGVEAIGFDLEESYAFEGTRDREGTKLAVESVTQDPKTRAISVNFSPPVAPGKLVTISLRPVHNPTIGGVYLFGVTAFPTGEKPYGQFLGYGRLQFYSHGGGGIR